LKLALELSKVIAPNTVVPVFEDYPGTPDVPRPRTRSVIKIVPPAQALISSLWVPFAFGYHYHGTIRSQAPIEGVNPAKAPFVIDGKTLHPVVERYIKVIQILRQPAKIY
jgi:hypothetical protein